MSNIGQTRIAIIPARGGSRRFPRKNISLLDGKPIITYSIKCALESKFFSRVIVSSDNDEILEISKAAGAEVFLRDKKLATDTAQELGACREILLQDKTNGEELPRYFCLIYPTAVFITKEDLKNAFSLFADKSEPKVIISVSNFNYHPYKAMQLNSRGYLEMLYPKECKQQSQGYPDLVASNGTFYWLETEAFLNSKEDSYYYTEAFTGYKIASERAIDINYPEDLYLAERLLLAIRENDREL